MRSGLKKAIPRFAPLILLGCILSCGGRDPFFPPSGAYSGVPQRSTLQGTMTQFENAYQDISLSLYQDLLPKDGSFEFFVAPGFVPENPVTLTDTARDTTMHYNGTSSIYGYWTQDIELKSQYALFQNAGYMEFSTLPDIQYFPIQLDSAGDTLVCEVLMTGGELDIFFNDPDTYPNQAITINCDFLVVRQPNKLYVIKKWYDLQTSS